MTELYDSLITQALPEVIADKPEVQALAMAVRDAVRLVLSLSDASRTPSLIDSLSGKRLDIVAAEMRTPSYSSYYTDTVKRILIKNTIAFYKKAGTVGAINRLVSAIFGDGEVVEWFNYSGEAQHFKVRTANPTVTAENIADFTAAVDSVKRKSSYLDEILIDLSADMTAFFGHALHVGDSITLPKMQA